jgi:hypothetical protein
MKSKMFKNIVIKQIPDAEFIGDVLVSPYPNIKVNGVIRKDHDILLQAISKFSYSSVIEAMLNPKIVIML